MMQAGRLDSRARPKNLTTTDGRDTAPQARTACSTQTAGN